MQLTLHADYALRVLLYLGSHPDRVVSTQEISKGYGISKHHLVRVVHRLSEAGYVNIMAGRYGGVALARDPAQIRIGDVVRSTETNLAVVECFDMKTNTCIIAPVCHLKGVLQDALQGFLAVLDRYTLADLMGRGSAQRLAAVFDRGMSRWGIGNLKSQQAAENSKRASGGSKAAPLQGLPEEPPLARS